jgi:hypothetical protein
MKSVIYSSKDTGDCIALFLCSGDEGDLLLLPAPERYSVPCFVICSKTNGVYKEGVWTNVSYAGVEKTISSLKEFMKNGKKMPDEKEHKLYLKLKAKYEKE